MSGHLLDQPHHDGSALYVDPPSGHRLGDRVRLRLRLPSGWGETAVKLWLKRDGDLLRLPARLLDTVAGETAGENWYEAWLPLDNPVTRYRWLLLKPGGYAWVTAEGVFEHDVTDAGDFRLTVFGPPPAWSDNAVGYQIFPDRFARSDASPTGPDHSSRSAAPPAVPAPGPNTLTDGSGPLPDGPVIGSDPLPDWVQPAAWADEPLPGGHRAGNQFFGGDLGGIEARADYLGDLGVDLVYLTPFFPAGSSHRYDASTFDRVDPLLGGDQGLASLVAALHRRGIKVIGDLTANHTGSGHQWFQRARAGRAARAAGGAGAAEESFYYWAEDTELDLDLWNQSFDDQWPGAEGISPARGLDYVAWLGVPSLPKLNWNSAELARRMIAGPESVIGRYLRPPFDLDGWRIDVAHMTGRFAADDLYHQVALTIRGTMDRVKPDHLLIAEHFHDPTGDLDGDGWHATMNYPGFLKPAWTWLAAGDLNPEIGFIDTPAPVPRRDGAVVVATLRQFASRLPWAASSHAWNMLGSHDTSRFRTITGRADRSEVGAAWLMTYTGLPAVFAGDEGGMTGVNGEHGRRPMPWDQIAQGAGSGWDGRAHQAYRRLIALRHDHEALRSGGLRWAFAHPDAIGYLRETADQRLLVVLARAPWPGLDLPISLLAADHPQPLYHPRTAQEAVLTAHRNHLRLEPTTGPAIGLWRLA
ncbi:MAG: glycoside hydrolase family 13 protein [Propionibacteriaceae bacterium]|nr:glycoside hydrolase family 13 protein [Propionibacteriaceae bacterium]